MKNIFSKISVSSAVLTMLLAAYPSYAKEVVMLKDGSLVQLNDDMTWQYFEPDSSSEEGKIVVSITKAVSVFREREVKDDFGEFKHFASRVYCKYELEVINKTEFKAKINRIALKAVSERTQESSKDDFKARGAVLEPGASLTLEPQIVTMIKSDTNQKTSEPADEELIKKLTKEFGCDSYSGNVFLHESALEPYFVKFEPSSGISDTSTWNFVVGSQNGVEPLDKPIKFYN